MLDGDSVIDQGGVLFLHHASEVLNLAEDGGQTDLFLFEPRAVDPNDTMHLIAFESNQG